MTQLVLGTAQWGTGYGITSQVARIRDDEVTRIIEVACRAGIAAVDTASAYGDAQQRLRPWAADFRVITKIPGKDPRAIERLIEESLDALGLNRVDTVLLHDWDALDIDLAKQAAGALERCRQSGLIRNAGVSAYEVLAIEQAAGLFEHLDAIQVPANALDRRLDEAPAVSRAHANGVRIAVRSAFLQGLLAHHPSMARDRHAAVEAFNSWARKRNRTPLAAALDHVRALPWAEDIVVGVTSSRELAEIVDAWKGEPSRAPADLASADLDLIDPRRWKGR